MLSTLSVVLSYSKDLLTSNHLLNFLIPLFQSLFQKKGKRILSTVHYLWNFFPLQQICNILTNPYLLQICLELWALPSGTSRGSSQEWDFPPVGVSCGGVCAGQEGRLLVNL